MTVPLTLDVGAITEEIIGPSRIAAARYQHGVVGRQLRQPAGRQPADVLQHADHAVALFTGPQRERCPDAGVAGLRGQHVAVGRLLARPAAGRYAEPATPPVGGNNYTIDGANNNGSNRRIAASPNSDMIQEMRVESANFDASVGHGLGLQISMMTRAGTNRQRGTVNYQYWSNKLNSLTEQQKTHLRRPREERVREGAVAQRVADLRRPGADSGIRGRPRQAVLLRQLLATPTMQSPARSRGRSRSRPTTSTCRAISRTCSGCRIRRSTRSTIR